MKFAKAHTVFLSAFLLLLGLHQAGAHLYGDHLIDSFSLQGFFDSADELSSPVLPVQGASYEAAHFRELGYNPEVTEIVESEDEVSSSKKNYHGSIFSTAVFLALMLSFLLRAIAQLRHIRNFRGHPWPVGSLCIAFSVFRL